MSNVKKRKPRKAKHKRANKLLERFGNICEYWDNGYPECFLPWVGKGEKQCNGNPFICKKLYYRYLASSVRVNQNIISEFDRRTSN